MFYLCFIEVYHIFYVLMFCQAEIWSDIVILLVWTNTMSPVIVTHFCFFIIFLCWPPVLSWLLIERGTVMKAREKNTCEVYTVSAQKLTCLKIVANIHMQVNWGKRVHITTTVSNLHYSKHCCTLHMAV